jgi:uncharacterized RDD family membrane protein YckC
MSAVPIPKSSSATANPYAPPRARVRDVAAPKAASVQLPAERSARLGAAIVDGLIFSAMVYIPLIVGSVLAAAGADSSSNAGGIMLLLGVGMAVLGFSVWLWMTLKQMKATGQSLAKKYFEIKVVRSDGSPASLGNLIWRRNAVNWILNIIPLYGLIEVLFIFRDDRQCLHDKIADTIVVQA